MENATLTIGHVTIKVETKGYGFVTNPGDEGHIDYSAPPEIQAQQRARRKELMEDFIARSKAQEGADHNG